VQPKVFAIRNPEGAEGLGSGNDVAFGVGHAQHDMPTALDQQAFAGELSQIDRVVPLEFMLDQERHAIDILDRSLRMLFELRGQTFRRARRSVGQRVLGGPQLYPRRRPHAGDEQQAESGQRPQQMPMANEGKATVPGLIQ
jgi:hypothetical protein